MLPYTPLHHLLFEGAPFDALVMTSGNISEEPIVVDNAQARESIGGVADWFLTHNRDIYMRTDDSVVRTFEGRERVLRRSRGYAPQTLDLGRTVPEILACGGELKNVFCLTKGRHAILSQHIGDLENYETLVFFKETLGNLKKLFRVEPRVVAHDLHPGYLSTQYALGLEGLPKIGVQHHHAHIAACMAENGLDTFRLVDGQRVHFRDGVRVHGYVTDGGQAVNIVPERAACEFSVRARDGAELERVRGIVERCARAAAMASDVQVTLSARRGYRDMVNNRTLARRFGAHLEALGRSPRECDERVGAGSTDMGDVSHVVPSIHPWLAIVGEGEAMCHEHSFAEAAGSDGGSRTALVAAKALARTAIEFLTDPGLRAAVTVEWGERSQRDEPDAPAP